MNGLTLLPYFNEVGGMQSQPTKHLLADQSNVLAGSDLYLAVSETMYVLHNHMHVTSYVHVVSVNNTIE